VSNDECKSEAFEQNGTYFVITNGTCAEHGITNQHGIDYFVGGVRYNLTGERPSSQSSADKRVNPIQSA
jgi:hypothetical protein